MLPEREQIPDISEHSELLNELVGDVVRCWRPEILHRLIPEMFFQPDSFEDEVAQRLHRLQDAMGADRYRAEVHSLLLTYRAAAERQLRKRLWDALENDFLGLTESTIQSICGELPIQLGLDERARYVQDWSDKHGISNLDLRQASAVASVHPHTLVTARAGSGKTRTIVARTLFLVSHCGVSPSQILILVFNRKAAEEVRERLRMAGVDCPHVMTFHALAYAVAHPEETLVIDEPNDGEMQRSALTQRVVNDFLSKPGSEERVRSVMSRHFKRDWDNIITSGAALSQKDGLLLRRSLEREAIDGTRVKSFGEKVISNFLFEHDVRYGYERNHWWGDRNYRPDFSLTGRKIVIEYFGMASDPDYDKEMIAKREYWENKQDWTLIEYGPRILTVEGEDGLRNTLQADLLKHGIPLRRLPEEEIWRRVQDRHLTRFAEVLTGLVGRSRKSLLTPAELDERVRHHTPLDDTERDVLAILQEVYTAYLDRMAAEGLEDFDGLMQRAAAAIAKGRTTFDRKSGAGNLASMRYIMVDEYQDFSPLFDLLLSAVLEQTGDRAQAFGVGDDWQAINAFAGSDLAFFHEFTKRHSPSSQLGVTTNYRSSKAVVELGNRIMSQFGAPAKSRPDAERGLVEIVDLAKFRPDTAERSTWEGDLITPAIRRLIRAPLESGKSVAILGRQRYLPFQVVTPSTGSYPRDDLGRLAVLLRHGLDDAARKQLHVGTVHQYKGREADVVIIADAVERRYPKLHPDWVFGRIFGDEPQKLIDDERRLFYVGCSRAVERLIIVTDSQRLSPFLDEVQQHLTQLQIERLAPFCPDDGDWILIVGNADGRGVEPTVQRAEVLKESQYSYHGGQSPHWAKRIPKKHSIESIVENLHKAPWFVGPDGLLISICRSDGKVLVTGEISGSKFHPT